MSQSNVLPLPAGARERIEAAVEAAFEAKSRPRSPSRRFRARAARKAPCQDMIARLLRERGYEIDDWIINQDDLKDLPGDGPVETDFSRARTVVGTLSTDAGDRTIADPPGSLRCRAHRPARRSAAVPTRRRRRLALRPRRRRHEVRHHSALYALDALKAAGPRRRAASICSR